jgi:hypothetical protein
MGAEDVSGNDHSPMAHDDGCHELVMMRGGRGCLRSHQRKSRDCGLPPRARIRVVCSNGFSQPLGVGSSNVFAPGLLAISYLWEQIRPAAGIAADARREAPPRDASNRCFRPVLNDLHVFQYRSGGGRSRLASTHLNLMVVRLTRRCPKAGRDQPCA